MINGVKGLLEVQIYAVITDQGLFLIREARTEKNTPTHTVSIVLL